MAFSLGSIKKALGSLDKLGDGAIQKNVLGMGGDEGGDSGGGMFGGAEEKKEDPFTQAAEGAQGEAAEGEMTDEEKRKLMELLAK